METNNQNLPDQVPSQTPQEPVKWYKHKGLIVIAILIVLAVVVSCVPSTDLVNEVNKNDSIISTQPVPAGWKDYKNDVLGLSFSYSPEWGDISTYPSENITDLKTLRDKSDNSFNPSLNINFNKNTNVNFPTAAPQVTIWSPKYGGLQYNGAGMGRVDNLLNLAESDSSCSYKISYQSIDSLQEIYNSCLNGVKVSVIEQTQYFNPANFGGTVPPNGILYTYSLNYYGYKHLQNGEFDYLLTFYTATSTHQQPAHLTAEEFLNKAGIKNNNYPNLVEFTTFVHSLKSYSPPVVETSPFTVPENEDPNITLIRKYYYQIATGQLNEAYGRLISPNFSQEEFNETYQNTYKIQPRDFKKLSENNYEFWIDYQGHNREAEQHRLIVQIINSKIKQELFDVLTSSIATFGNMAVYGASRGEESIVVLRQNGIDSIIDLAPNNFDKTLETLIFVDVSFSPQGNYIMYVGGGWEWAYLRIYDIKNKKLALETSGGHGEFSPSESIYFFCEANEMSGNYAATVYKVPEFSVKVDLLKQHSEELKNFWNITCSADEKNRLIHFNFNGKYDKDGNYDEKASKTYNVNLDTGEAVN